ncbi:MAG: hypothetical protein KGR26_02890 [Cyanobacteria bacterium REEB65]|nr:hypothetical protein [Cyanobacteria bacterium REEB65]
MKPVEALGKENGMIARLPCSRRAMAVALAGLLLSGAPLPARADTVYLKDGTKVEGTIVKQDAAGFQVQVAAGVVKVPAALVAHREAPQPAVALVLGLGLPGAGNAYCGNLGKAAFYLGLTALSFGLSFGLVRFAQGSAQLVVPLVTGVGTAVVPWGVGAFEAYKEAERADAEPRFKIDYQPGQ